MDFAGSICLVANQLDGVVRNGGVGTYYALVARLLARAGWRVHVLSCGPVEEREALPSVRRRLHDEGVGLTVIDGIPYSAPFDRGTFLAWTQHVRDTLVELHRTHELDVIEFAEWRAPGFATVAAKRDGAAFRHVALACKLHGPVRWARAIANEPLRPAEDQRDEYERFSFEHADFQMSPSRYLLDYVAGHGWRVNGDAAVVPNPFPTPPAVRVGSSGATPPELVFFGRLETRKGIELFVDAMADFDPAVPITFLGRERALINGELASEYVRRRLPGRTLRFLTTYTRDQALAYLRDADRLAVIASVADNFPYTVVECATAGIPFVASKVGGIAELVSSSELREHVLFDPRPADLSRCIREYLGLDPLKREALNEQARAVANPAEVNARIVAAYGELLDARRLGGPDPARATASG